MQDDEVAVLLDGIAERMHDVLACRIRLNLCQVLRQRFTGDRQALTVQQACIKQHFH